MKKTRSASTKREPFNLGREIIRLDRMAGKWAAASQANGRATLGARGLKALATVLWGGPNATDVAGAAEFEKAILRVLKSAAGQHGHELLEDENREVYEKIIQGLERRITKGGTDVAKGCATWFVVMMKSRRPTLLRGIVEARTDAEQKALVASLTTRLERVALTRAWRSPSDQSETWLRELLSTSGMPRKDAHNALKYRIR